MLCTISLNVKKNYENSNHTWGDYYFHICVENNMIYRQVLETISIIINIIYLQ